MNRSMIRFILGKVLWIEGLLILPVCLTGLIYRETVGLWYLAVAAGATLCGVLLQTGAIRALGLPGMMLFELAWALPVWCVTVVTTRINR